MTTAERSARELGHSGIDAVFIMDRRGLLAEAGVADHHHLDRRLDLT